MIPISKPEAQIIREKLPNVHITIVNREHPSRAKGYYMTCEKDALTEISGTNSAARRELVGILENELRRCYKDKKKQEEFRKQIRELRE